MRPAKSVAMALPPPSRDISHLDYMAVLFNCDIRKVTQLTLSMKSNSKLVCIHWTLVYRLHNFDLEFFTMKTTLEIFSHPISTRRRGFGYQSQIVQIQVKLNCTST